MFIVGVQQEFNVQATAVGTSLSFYKRVNFLKLELEESTSNT